MLTHDQAQEFAQDWIAAWNSHDLEQILAHYTDDIEMSSPFIVHFANEPTGTLRGKAKVGAYWQIALEKVPDLHFELLDVLICVQSMTIYYRSIRGFLTAEVLFFNESGQVYKAFGHYNRG